MVEGAVRAAVSMGEPCHAAESLMQFEFRTQPPPPPKKKLPFCFLGVHLLIQNTRGFEQAAQ